MEPTLAPAPAYHATRAPIPVRDRSLLGVMIPYNDSSIDIYITDMTLQLSWSNHFADQKLMQLGEQELVNAFMSCQIGGVVHPPDTKPYLVLTIPQKDDPIHLYIYPTSSDSTLSPAQICEMYRTAVVDMMYARMISVESDRKMQMDLMIRSQVHSTALLANIVQHCQQLPPKVAESTDVSADPPSEDDE